VPGGHHSEPGTTDGPAVVLDRAGLDQLVDVLRSRGLRVIGPTVRDQAIVLDELITGRDLPDGWGVDTGPGRYRLVHRSDEAVFAHSAGPQSWKQFLHPARQRLWATDGATFTQAQDESPPMAFLGVRACDLAAIATLGTVLSGGRFADAGYVRRRRGLFIVAVGCTEPGGVCFCASAGTGPTPGPGYDLSMVERAGEAGPEFVVRVGTEHGRQVLDEVTHRTATSAEVDEVGAALAAAAGQMSRSLPEGDLRSLLRDSRESPVWQEVATRCLTCGNCTMVCPTCFCTTTEDVTDLDGAAERSQRWASCFEVDFSYVHGGSVRSTGASRYRQWMSHKLATWYDQFGTSGCVGCGRCIAWCPVGIDITEEAHRLAAITPPAGSPTPHAEVRS
jgi:ferredoxin